MGPNDKWNDRQPSIWVETLHSGKIQAEKKFQNLAAGEKKLSLFCFPSPK